jgi:hypothetical protein
LEFMEDTQVDLRSHICLQRSRHWTAFFAPNFDLQVTSLVAGWIKCLNSAFELLVRL